MAVAAAGSRPSAAATVRAATRGRLGGLPGLEQDLGEARAADRDPRDAAGTSGVPGWPAM